LFAPRGDWRILLGLPAKSVLRFRSVCKTWYSLISNSRFANAYLARSNQRPSPYFLFGRREHEKVCFSLHSNPAIDSSDFIEFHPPYEKTLFQIVGSVNGLICLVDSHGELHEKYYLWNPSINRTVQLPFVRNLLSAKCNYCPGFGYHAPTNEYKVAGIMHFDNTIGMVEICALNVLTFIYGKNSVFMNGRLHWLAQDYPEQEDDTCHNFILSFDLGYEIGDENIVYHEVPVPKTQSNKGKNMSDYLPAEVIEEILLGLPAKSVLRFRSVCKTWYSLISNSRFAKAYLARSNERSSPYFLFGRFGYEKEIFNRITGLSPNYTSG
ncbi:f-box/kelch-repeat protein, partial [Quercus suber]